MDAKEWMLDYINEMPVYGVLNISGHPDEIKLRDAGILIITDYNDIYREEGFEIRFSNDYSSIIKDVYPF